LVKSKCYSQRISLKLPFKGGDIDRGSRARNAPRIGTRRMPTINRLLLESPQSRTSASVDVRMCGNRSGRMVWKEARC
jgi:hypothetical protein